MKIDELNLPEGFPPIIIIDNAFYIGKVFSDDNLFKIDENYAYNGFSDLNDLISYYNYEKDKEFKAVNSNP